MKAAYRVVGLLGVLSVSKDGTQHHSTLRPPRLEPGSSQPGPGPWNGPHTEALQQLDGQLLPGRLPATTDRPQLPDCLPATTDCQLQRFGRILLLLAQLQISPRHKPTRNGKYQGPTSS